MFKNFYREVGGGKDQIDELFGYTHDDSGGECTPNSTPFGSPDKYTAFGSPDKYLPQNWSLSFGVLPEPKRFDALITERHDSLNEFHKNGIDVPIDGQTVKKLNERKYTSTYELFGRNNFNYARIGSIGDQSNDLSSRIKPKNKRRVKSQTYCAFCKNNNETPEMYTSHVLKDPFGRTMCPILREYDCPVCRSGGGDNGHTIRYCPKNKPDGEEHIPSVIKLLKSSRSADGKRRAV